MNIANSTVCSPTSHAEKGKIEIRTAITFLPESTVESEMTDKNIDALILVACRYRPSAEDSHER